MSDNPFADMEVIHAYSRAQAIEDGFMVDVSETAKEAGFKWPMAMTRTLWEDCVAWNNDTERAYQDESGRLWDVLWMARHAVHRSPRGGNELMYAVLRIKRGEIKPTNCAIKLVVGPGDNGEPVMTLMLPGED